MLFPVAEVARRFTGTTDAMWATTWIRRCTDFGKSNQASRRHIVIFIVLQFLFCFLFFFHFFFILYSCFILFCISPFQKRVILSITIKGGMSYSTG